VILLISASQIARITGVNHLHPVWDSNFIGSSTLLNSVSSLLLPPLHTSFWIFAALSRYNTKGKIWLVLTSLSPQSR
jgi:hypothetical protein